MRKGTKLYFDRRIVAFIAVLTVAVVLILTLFTVFSIISVNELITKYCFDELENTSKDLADKMYDSTGTDRTILSAIATIIAMEDSPDIVRLCEIINAYSLDESYMSYMELLRPDNIMLDADGKVRNVSEAFDFEREAKKGAYISHIRQSTRDPNEPVIHSAMPVVKDGQTVYILYGVVRLSELAENYRTSIYGGHAYVFIVDGDTGDFILDTWHKTLGNITEMGNRKTLPGYSLDNLVKDLSEGVGGNIGFVSKTTGTILYMRYDRATTP